MFNKLFSLTMVAFGLCLVTSVSYAGEMDQQMDQQMDKLLRQVETNISQITSGTNTLTELLHSSKKSGNTWERHHSELSQVQRRLDKLSKLIPESLQNGGYVMVSLSSVRVTEVVATLEALDWEAHEAMQILERNKDVTRFAEDAEYRSKIFVMGDFAQDIGRIMN